MAGWVMYCHSNLASALGQALAISALNIRVDNADTCVYCEARIQTWCIDYKIGALNHSMERLLYNASME